MSNSNDPKKEDYDDETWERLGKPDDDVEYDENEQPKTVTVGGEDE
jgi:hypothetical protein